MEGCKQIGPAFNKRNLGKWHGLQSADGPTLPAADAVTLPVVQMTISRPFSAIEPAELDDFTSAIRNSPSVGAEELSESEQPHTLRQYQRFTSKTALCAKRRKFMFLPASQR